MPKSGCNFKGDEISPKFYGFCAHLEKEGKIRAGGNGKPWIVKAVKGGILRWVPLKAHGYLVPKITKSTKTRTLVAKKTAMRSKTPRTNKSVPVRTLPQSGYTISVEYATSGRSKCKLCKNDILYGDLRLVKTGFNPFAPDTGVELSQFYHAQHGFEMLKKARCRTKKPKSIEDIKGINSLRVVDRAVVKKMFNDYLSFMNNKC
jgi:hypothetical protein